MAVSVSYTSASQQLTTACHAGCCHGLDLLISERRVAADHSSHLVFFESRPGMAISPHPLASHLQPLAADDGLHFWQAAFHTQFSQSHLLQMSGNSRPSAFWPVMKWCIASSIPAGVQMSHGKMYQSGTRTGCKVLLACCHSAGICLPFEE